MRGRVLVWPRLQRQQNRLRGAVQPECHDRGSQVPAVRHSRQSGGPADGESRSSVTINDRGPYHGGRIIDLSKAAATKLGFRGRGTTKVCITQV